MKDLKAFALDEIIRLRQFILDMKPYMDYPEVRSGVKDARREIDSINRFRLSVQDNMTEKKHK